MRSQNSKFASKTGFVFVSNTKHKYKKPKITTIFDHFHTKHNFSKHKTQRLSFSFVTKTTKHKTMFVFCTNTRVNTFVFCVFCVCTYENLGGHRSDEAPKNALLSSFDTISSNSKVDMFISLGKYNLAIINGKVQRINDF